MRRFYKFMARYPELASKFNKTPSSVICDSVPMAQSHETFSQLMTPGVMYKAGQCLVLRHLMPSLNNILRRTFDKRYKGSMWRVDDCYTIG